MLHAQGDDVVHGAAAKFATAEAAKVLGTEMAVACEPVERPGLAEPGGHMLPKVAETVVCLPGTGETQDVGMDELHPMTGGRGRGLASDFLIKAADCELKRQGIESRERR